MKITKSLSLSLLLLLMCTTGTTEQAETTKPTENQRFRISFTSQLEPIAINTMHTWVIHVADINGQPISDAEISVDGGMPEHDHGLPSQPQVTRSTGAGNYLVEGMKFHMSGAWTVTMTITHGNISDQVTFDLDL